MFEARGRRRKERGERSPVLLQLPARNATNPAPYSPSYLKSCDEGYGDE